MDTIPSPRLTRRSLLGLALALPFSRAQAAAEIAWPDVVQRANAEQQVLLYSTRSDADNAKLVAAFHDAFPHIQAKTVRLVGGALTARVDQEVGAGALAADVLLHSENQWSAAKAAAGELIVPYGPAVPLWKGAEPYYDKGAVVITSEPWVIGYNTKLVSPAPKDWDTLLNEERFKGMVGLNEVSGLTVAIWYDFIEKKKPGYFEALAKLSPRIYPNSAPLTAGLGSGEIAWAPYSLISSLDPLMKSGAPVNYVVPASGTWGLERAAMVLKGAPHPNAALVLLDFMMSQKGQELLNGGRTGFTAAPGITLADGLQIDRSQVVHVDYGAYRLSETRRWQGLVTQLFRH